MVGVAQSDLLFVRATLRHDVQTGPPWYSRALTRQARLFVLLCSALPQEPLTC